MTSASLTGPRRILQRPSKFTRELVRSSLGGEVHALSEMVDQMAPKRDFYEPFQVLVRGMVGLEDC